MAGAIELEFVESIFLDSVSFSNMNSDNGGCLAFFDARNVTLKNINSYGAKGTYGFGIFVLRYGVFDSFTFEMYNDPDSWVSISSVNG